MADIFRRHDYIYGYVNPEKELNAGIWTLYAGATAFLIARVWTKLERRSGLWWDDYILLLAWVSKGWLKRMDGRSPTPYRSILRLQISS